MNLTVKLFTLITKTKDSRKRNKTINQPTKKINEDRKLSPPRKGSNKQNKQKQKQNKNKNKKTMKKILFLIGLSILTFGAFAEKVPSVIVNKSKGGFSAIFNLYNYVSYTPAEVNSDGIGHLDCSGNGFSACRVPNCNALNTNNGNSVVVETESGKLNSFKQAINDVIQQYEVALENHAAAVAAGTHTKAVPKIYTKTIATTSKSSGKLGKQKGETYVVRGVVNKQTDNTSTMTIYIEKTNLLYAGN